ncbi:helix-turn-helix domain-containing protein [Candidatus Latescibacterota bacterium]
MTHYNAKLRGAIVRYFRTQDDFANAIGVDRTIVSRVILGRRSLSHDEKIRWAGALRAPVEALFPESADVQA